MKKKLFLLMLTLMFTLFAVACDSKKSSKDSSVSDMPRSDTTEMNFKQIQAGNYASIQGTWKEVAYAYNPQNATGVHWKSVKSLSNNTLTVTSDKINFNDSVALMKGNKIKDQEGYHSLKFRKEEGALFAHIMDLYSVNAWEIMFFPKGIDATKKLSPNGGVKIDHSKNIICVFVTGDNQVVFEQSNSK